MDPLYDLAMEYHYKTEHFDRLCCTGPISKYGGILPRTEREWRDSSSYARQMRHDILKRAESMGIPQQYMAKAISSYAHLFDYEREHARRSEQKPPAVIMPSY